MLKAEIEKSLKLQSNEVNEYTATGKNLNLIESFHSLTKRNAAQEKKAKQTVFTYN